MSLYYLDINLSEEELDALEYAKNMLTLSMFMVSLPNDQIIASHVNKCTTALNAIQRITDRAQP